MVEQRKLSPYPRTPVGPLRPTDPVDAFDYLYERTKAQKEKLAKKMKLRESFRALMEMSDDQLRIHNSNQRNLERRGTRMVYYPDDIVFREIAKLPERQRFENRTLTAEEYARLSKRPDLVRLHVTTADLNIDALIRYTDNLLTREAADPRANGYNGNTPQFKDYVLGLVKGAELSKKEIEENGFNSKLLIRKAQICVSGYQFNAFHPVLTPKIESK